jgi:hypothetical protein
MKTELVSLGVMLCLVALAIVGAPSTALACSGENCGCYYPACEEQCSGLTGAAYDSCRLACIRAQVQCAVACCAGG